MRVTNDKIKKLCIEHKWLLLVLLSFVVLLAFGKYQFFLDEVDNILGANSIARGGIIYRDFYSQHTPFMYYFMAFFSVLGASSVESFRFCMAVMLLLMWLFLYFRYNNLVGKLSLCLYPVIYISTIPQSWGHMVLSDVVQGQLMVLLFLETLHYLIKKEITIASAIIYSLGIWMSIGSAFLSVYSLLFLCLIPAFYEIKRYRRAENKLHLLRSHVIVAIILIFPLLVYTIYLAAYDLLRDAWYQMYTFNREVYAGYTYGFGTDAIGAFIDTILRVINYVISSFDPRINIQQFLYIFAMIIGGIALQSKILFKKGVSFLFVIAIACCGIRSVSDFHGLPFFCIASLLIAYMLQFAFGWIRNNSNSAWKLKVVTYSWIFVYGLYSLVGFIPIIETSMSSYIKGIAMEPETIFNRIVEVATEKDDPVWTASISNVGVYTATGRRPASRMYSLVPWFAEVFSDTVIKDLEKEQPKIIHYDPDESVWGVTYKDFAADVEEYIMDNYTQIPRRKNVFINNNYYQTTVNLLETSDVIPTKLVFSVEENQLLPIDAIKEGRKVSQIFIPEGDSIAEIDVFFATYIRTNHSSLKMILSEHDSNTQLHTAYIDVPSLKDTSYHTIYLPHIEVEKGKQYVLTFEASGTNDSDAITIIRSGPNKNPDRGYALIDGKKQDYNLCINIYGK
jgi:hypothetical protein